MKKAILIIFMLMITVSACSSGQTRPRHKKPTKITLADFERTFVDSCQLTYASLTGLNVVPQAIKKSCYQMWIGYVSGQVGIEYVKHPQGKSL